MQANETGASAFSTTLASFCAFHLAFSHLPSRFFAPSISFFRTTHLAFPHHPYTVPDLDATVKINFESKAKPGVSVACVEAQLSNGQTVDQKGVSWATTGYVGSALIVSPVIT
jgi:hypothetical protein